MADRQCPFLEYKSGTHIFSASYRCMKTGEDVMTGSALYEQYCNNYESSYKNCPHFGPKKEESSGGCFLTSACTEALGLADDCAELTTLRAFRDGWLREQPDGAAAISRYYEIAPGIVRSIHSRPDALKIFRSIYDHMVRPCVELIHRGQNREAFALYAAQTEKLEREYGETR